MYTKIVFVVIGVLIITGVFSFYFSKEQSIKLVGSNEFEKLIANPDVFVLQVHTPYYAEIEGTDFIEEDWENLDSYLSLLPKDKKEPIAVYCRSGRMSGIVAKELAERGYKNIYDLEGGMNAWVSSGRELITK